MGVTRVAVAFTLVTIAAFGLVGWWLLQREQSRTSDSLWTIPPSQASAPLPIEEPGTVFLDRVGLSEADGEVSAGGNPVVEVIERESDEAPFEFEIDPTGAMEPESTVEKGD